jgi:hypothetical protein
VWNKEDQWERLWADIIGKADTRILGDQPVPHFLGAVVLEPQSRQGLLGVETLHIIDGQQRLTTLQYVLAGLAIALRSSGVTPLLSLVEGCQRNPNLETMEQPDIEIFKLWPTFRDREPYRLAMEATNYEELRERFPDSFTQAGSLRKVGIDHPPALEAICYFYDQIMAWITQEGDSKKASRLQAVSEAVLRDLKLVSIALGEEDDAQVIFETLNGHGAQLHATDLIRNFIFMRADRDGGNAGEIYDLLWSPFEGDFWVEEQRRGRLKRPRLEWFFSTALQAELGEEIDIGRLYVGYRRFAAAKKPPITASEQLKIMNLYAEKYKMLISGSGNDPIASYGRRVSAWDASTTFPLALLIAKSGATVQEQTKMLDCMLSYLIRRAVCGLTTKNYNKIFIQQLKKLIAGEISADRLRSALALLDGDASRWPRDDEFRKAWLEAALYEGRIDSARVKSLLSEVESGMRSTRSEEPMPSGLENLDVDHILPTSWFEHWPLPDGSFAKITEATEARVLSYSEQPLPTRMSAILQRERTKVTIGNLTLLHYGINRGLKHHAFPAKREALFAESNLHLNRGIMRAQNWDEAAIERRGRDLFEVAKKLWQGPESST